MKKEFGTKIWEEEVTIPTYKIGEPNKNPMFLEKRVYQGSSGKVYPYPVIDKITDEKEDKKWIAVFLENEYIKVMVLPELGGRIQRALDKTNNYDFVYYNHVIKPALVGLLGPWISGGIEFNWPQHHRPTTYMPVEYEIKENADGSKSVLCHDVDQINGTKVITTITVYPGKAYIEIKGQLYNRTSLPQTFLWWANPAVPVNDYTQSVFPPDVHAVMDHGKRDVSRFPIATGVYYKHDYSEGVDISRFKNIPVPTSYMAAKSDFNFVGGYDYREQAGILHVADHHVSPGKKQWTWGCGDFGKVWYDNLTDSDGAYIELMTGVFTDNQPDFTWLKPFEEKVFTQYFMPYKGLGYIKNATKEAAVNLEFEKGKATFSVYVTSPYKKLQVLLLNKGKEIYKKTLDLTPAKFFQDSVVVTDDEKTDYTIVVLDKDNAELVSFTPLKEKIEKLPSPAEAAKPVEEIRTNEELYLTGLHIEQYRHATYLPDPYYLEGLKRDPLDSRINVAYGSLLLSRGAIKESVKYFENAIKRLTWKNPNPYNGEAFYKLGLALFLQGNYKKAYDLFYKATWSDEQQETGFYYLAAIATRFGDYQQAYQFITRALVKNSENIKARDLKLVLLRKLGRTKEAENFAKENLTVDSFDYLTAHELTLLEKDEGKALKEKYGEIIHGNFERYLMVARDYAEFGCFEEALQILEDAHSDNPLIHYYKAYYLTKLNKEGGLKEVEAGEKASSYCVFPNKLEDIPVLENAIALDPKASFAPYYLGNLFYDKKQYEKAASLWELSTKNNSTFPTVYRNLSLAYYNHLNKPTEAKKAIEKAFELDPTDSRIFLELDQLYKKFNQTPAERLKLYEKYLKTALDRDDTYVEYVTLLNSVGQFEKAYKVLMAHQFHPWEGGEGKPSTQYVLSLLELAKIAYGKKDYKKAKELLTSCLDYPTSLGEGRLEGTKLNHVYYWLGLVEEKLGNEVAAKEDYEHATEGQEEVAGMMFYNDQPADMVMYQGLAKYKLGRKGPGNACMYRLMDYGEQHINDDVKISYFAVSFPDFMIYEEDFNKKNRAHCNFVLGLANYGLGNIKKAKAYFEETLKLDPSHENCRLYLAELEK